MSELDEQVEVTLMRLLPEDYTHLARGDDGTLLTERFPEQMYATLCDGQILEVAPDLTDRMRAMGFKEF